MTFRRIFPAVVVALAVGAGLAAPASAATPTAAAPVLTGPTSVATGSTATYTVAFVPTDGCTSATFDIEETAPTAGTFTSFGSATSFSTDANGNSTATATTGALGMSGQSMSYTVKVVLGGCTGTTGSGAKETVVAPTLTASGAAILATTTTVSASPTSVVAGPSASVSLTAVISNGTNTPPTGTVTFSIGGVILGSGPVTLDSTGTATLANVGGWGQAGTVTITANYGGDGTDTGSQGSIPVLVTAPALSSTSVTVSATPTSFLAGATATLTAVVVRTDGSGVATGSVNFMVNGTSVATVGLDSTGTATYQATQWSPGTYVVTAQYGGDTADNGSTGTDPVAVSVGPAPASLPTTTSLSASPTLVTAGDFMTMSATVSPVNAGGPSLTGAVAFFDNGLIIADAPLVSGTATLVEGGWVAGSDDLSAEYLGDSNYLTSKSNDLGLTVNAIPSAVSTTTTISVAPDPIVAGQPATLIAVINQQGVATAPVGDQVVFYANKVDSDGVIEPQALIGEAPVTTVNGQSQADLTAAGWTEGNYIFTASYLGDIANDPSNGNVSVAATGLSNVNLMSSATSSTFGQAVTFSAQVAAVPPATDTPTGSVTFSAVNTASHAVSTLCSAVSLLSGAASCSTSAVAPGSYTVTATYSGDSNFPTASASLTQTVNAIPVTVEVSGSLSYNGSSPAFASSASGGLPSGVNLTVSCTTVDTGMPIVSSPPLAVGSYTIDGSSCSGSSAPTGYTLIYVGGPFTVSPAAVTATVSASMVYGSGAPVFTAGTSIPLVAGASLVPVCTTVNGGTVIASTSLNVGSYPIDASSCSSPTIPGYTVTFAGGNLTVGPSAAVVTVSGAAVAGSNSVSLTDIVSPAIALSGTLTCSTVDANTPINQAGVGSHTILGSSCSGLSAANYAVSYQGAVNGYVVTAPASCVLIFTSGSNVTTVTGISRGNYEVKNGSTLYLAGGTITGNVTVDSGGSFLARAGSVLGNVQSQGGPVSIQGATISGNVQTIGPLALGAGTYVGGNVQVNGGTTMCSLGNTVGGAVKVDGNVQVQDLSATSNQVAICDTNTKGNLQYQSNAAPAVFGGSASCLGNAIGGNIQIQSNSASLTIGGVGFGNTAAGNIQVQNNTGGGGLTANSAGGNCQLQSNVPGIVGSGNTARGQNTGNRTA